MSTHFRIDCASKGASFPHYWETIVGSSHAPLALRADWQAQLKLAHGKLGFSLPPLSIAAVRLDHATQS